jgi:hypothetical protein
LKNSSILELFPAKVIPLKVAENHQVWTGCFDSVLQLNMHGIIQETGQKYRREKYILNGENITMKLVRETLLENFIICSTYVIVLGR